MKISKKVIFTTGGKGGVGKTTISTALAEWYIENQIPCTLLDLDTENKKKGSFCHFFPDRAIKIDINTPAGLDAFIDHADKEPAIILADIGAGKVIGVVGRSGSGKSTLTKLIQRLYLPGGGRVSVDGIDLALADPAWLRRNIGVVLQENILFNRSIRENIAVTDPGTSLDLVIQSAKLAGAHDFISELPEGYDTRVGEHGTGLSGGQRQRIAIARALITNLRILIFDEATSALDFETERIIQDNMQAMCRGRTVIIISHRLTAVRQADQIIVMEKGQIIERGTHDELLALGKQYAHLISLQNSS